MLVARQGRSRTDFGKNVRGCLCAKEAHLAVYGECAMGYGSMYTAASPFITSVLDWLVQDTASLTIGLSSRTEITVQVAVILSSM